MIFLVFWAKGVGDRAMILPSMLCSIDLGRPTGGTGNHEQRREHGSGHAHPL